MFFAKVTPLLHNGMRLKPGARPSVRGTVTIEEWDRDQNNFRRNVVVANVWHRFGTTAKRSEIVIFEPSLVPYSGPGFLMSGIALETGTAENGESFVKEHRQIWLVVPTHADSEE